MKCSLPIGNCVTPALPTDRPIKVFFNVDLFIEHFKVDETFVLVDDPSKADILWLNNEFKEYK